MNKKGIFSLILGIVFLILGFVIHYVYASEPVFSFEFKDKKNKEEKVILLEKDNINVNITKNNIEDGVKNKNKNTKEMKNNIVIPKLKKEINKIPILMYHHLTYDSSKWNDSTISPLKFKEDMLYLKVLGYTPIHFKDYIAYKEEGKRLPDNPIIITFDDGYLSNYKYAYPILKELNMKATISMIGWSVGRKYHKDGITPINEHFTWEQAKKMYESGFIDIQHHTFDLHNTGDNITCGLGVSKLPNETEEEYEKRFIEDTLKMKKLIEEKIGNEVILFVYPYGIYNETTERIIKRLGFKVSVTTKEGISDMSKGLYLLNRINVPQNLSSPELMEKILKLQGQNIEVPFKEIKDSKERIKKLEELLDL